jgi:branched-chain amino acid transport system permease protein
MVRSTMSKGLFKVRSRVWAYLGIALLLFLPAFLSRFYVYLASLALLYGLFVVSLNIPLGYGGIYQFGHAVFFGIGAYGAALIIMKAELSPWIGFIVGPIISALLSVVMGTICIRLSKLYFGMLQISLGYLVWIVAYRWHDFTGGDDGIHGIPIPDIISSPTRAYYFTLLVTTGCLFIIYKMIRSPFGTVLQSVRDNPVRSEMNGVNVRLHRLETLIAGGLFAGVAGVLFVVVCKIRSTSNTNSTLYRTPSPIMIER